MSKNSVKSKKWDRSQLQDFANSIARLHDQSELPFMLHLAGGNEDELISIFAEIADEDYVLSSHRNMYHALLKGIPAPELFEHIVSGRSMSIFDYEKKFLVSGIIGGTPGIAAGLALALKRKNLPGRVWCFVGDGTEDTGHFAEAVRYVDSQDLPCIFVIEDDGWAADASKQLRWGNARPLPWPPCVRRYTYEKTWPHVRTGKPLDFQKLRTRTKDSNEIYPVPLQSVEPSRISSIGSDYQTEIKNAMTMLGKSKATFVGYSLIPGNAAGSLSGVSDTQKIETPVAENLMVGLGIGLAIEGLRPVVYFERHDFLLVAADAIVNHVDKLERLSLGQFRIPMVLRTVVADGSMFYGGPTHSQDFTKAFQAMVSFPVLDAHSPSDIASYYRFANEWKGPVMVVEHKKYMY